jgi:GT2 family glycosyltransferase
MHQPLVYIVILNTNRRWDTLEALRSIYDNTYTNHHVIVLDNASHDGSVSAIRSAFPQASIIELEKNLGYAGNNNHGIQLALQDGAYWVLVLNEDVVLAPDCIERLVAVGQNDEDIGIVGPMVYHHDEPDVIQSAGGKLSKCWRTGHIGENELDVGQYDQPQNVDWISGCAIMVRRSVIEHIGMLDERFFYYFEETEWCLRARKKGWRAVQVPQAKLWHKGVQREYQPSSSVTYYSTRNRLLMLAKHNAPMLAWLAAWGQTLRTLVSWSLRPKWRTMREHRDAMWQGIMDFFLRRWGMRPLKG